MNLVNGFQVLIVTPKLTYLHYPSKDRYHTAEEALERMHWANQRGFTCTAISHNEGEMERLGLKEMEKRFQSCFLNDGKLKNN